MSESEHVVCGTHGSIPVTFACRHLASGIACGFHCDDAEPWPDAWCDACDEARGPSGSSDEQTASVIKVLCTHCWESARARNEHVPPRARGHASRLTGVEEQLLITTATEQLNLTQAAAETRWGFTKFPHWHFSDETRTLTFSDTAPRIVADVRMVGSYSTRSNSFQWSWALHERNDPMIGGIAELQSFGEVRGIDRLTTTRWDCDIVDAWAMTSIASYLLGCEGVYRAPFDHLYWFMLLSGFREAA